MCQSKVSVTKPYGNPKIADLLVIGHDPRLQESDTEAEYVFFMDYLERELPKQKLELRKYSLAKAVIDYISYLTGNRYGIESTLSYAFLCARWSNILSGICQCLLSEYRSRYTLSCPNTLPHTPRIMSA